MRPYPGLQPNVMTETVVRQTTQITDDALWELYRAVAKLQKGQKPVASPTTPITGGGTGDHHLLTNLFDPSKFPSPPNPILFDDHPQYFNILGRAGGQTAYGGLGGGSLFLIGNTLSTSPSIQMLSGDVTMHLVGGSTGSVFVHGRKGNSSFPVEFGGGLDFNFITIPGTVYVVGGGNLAHTPASITIDESSGFGTHNQPLLQVKGASAQSMAAGVGGMYQSFFASGSATANHMGFWAPGSIPGSSSPTTFIDKNGAFNGPVIGSTTTGSSFQDSLFTLFDNVTPSKKAQFECANISASTTRTYTFPDVSDTLAVKGTDNAFTANQTIGSSATRRQLVLWDDNTSLDGGILINNTNGTGSFYLSGAGSTGFSQINFPDGGGLLMTDISTNSVTNKTLLNTGFNILECSSTSGSVLFSKGATHTAGMRLLLTATTGIRVLTYPVDQSMSVAGRLGTASALGQTGNVAATNVVASVTTAELYTVGVYVKVNSATPTATITVNVTWNDGAAQNQNVVNAVGFGAAGQTNGVIQIRSAAAQAIQFTTTVTGTINYDVYVRASYS